MFSLTRLVVKKYMSEGSDLLETSSQMVVHLRTGTDVFKRLSAYR